MTKSRVKILKSYFDEDKDVVTWLVLFLTTGEERTLCWPSPDLAQALNINAEIPPDLMREFCMNIEGKELNLIIEGEPMAPDITETTIEDNRKAQDIADNISDILHSSALQVDKEDVD